MSLDYQERLRQGSFISPAGIEIEFQTDTLTRRAGKKISTQEIIDSDESITQEQGNKTYTFPIDMYFIGDNFDTILDDFEALLKEPYTLLTPGILKHPMWGDINVFPTGWESTIELINGVGIGKISVEFVEVFPIQYPDSTLNNTDIVSNELNEMSLIDSASQMATGVASVAANIAGKIRAISGVIANAVKFLEAIESEVLAIQNEIDNLIDDVAGNITSLLFVTQRLMRLPSRIIDNTLNKVNTYRDMITDIIDSIQDDQENNPVNLKNNAILMQTFAGFAVGCLAESSLYTNFSIRTDSISTLETIENSLSEYNTALSIARTDGNVSNEYSGDHNFQSFLFDLTLRARELLLNKAFSLKAEKTIILKENSDPITLCYKYYGDVEIDTIDYFLTTNNIKNDEFIELPVGRKIVIYV